MPKILRAALLAFALIFVLSACGGPTPNGVVLQFAEGESKTLTNGENFSILTYEDGEWSCADERGGKLCVQKIDGEVMFFFATEKIGAEDLGVPGRLNLYGDWGLDIFPVQSPMDAEEL